MGSTTILTKDNFIIVLGFIVFSFLMLLIAMGTKLNSHKNLATVNVTKIIDQFVKDNSKQAIPKEILQLKVKTFSSALNESIKNLAQKNNLVLLPSEAVLQGAPDYTAYIEKILQEKVKS